MEEIMKIVLFSKNDEFTTVAIQKLKAAGHDVNRVTTIGTEKQEEIIRDMLFANSPCLFIMDVDTNEGNGPEFSNDLFQISHEVSQLCQQKCLMDKTLIHPHMLVLSRKEAKFDFYKTVVHQSTGLQGIKDADQTIQEIIDSIVEH
jgi:hypothetical protein